MSSCSTTNFVECDNGWYGENLTYLIHIKGATMLLICDNISKKKKIIFRSFWLWYSASTQLPNSTRKIRTSGREPAVTHVRACFCIATCIETSPSSWPDLFTLLWQSERSFGSACCSRKNKIFAPNIAGRPPPPPSVSNCSPPRLY